MVAPVKIHIPLVVQRLINEQHKAMLAVHSVNHGVLILSQDRYGAVLADFQAHGYPPTLFHGQKAELTKADDGYYILTIVNAGSLSKSEEFTKVYKIEVLEN